MLGLKLYLRGGTAIAALFKVGFGTAEGLVDFTTG
jgi:hypothetical protein